MFFDGSQGSEQALNRAMMLLDEYGELFLLAVIPSPSDKTFVNKLKMQRKGFEHVELKSDYSNVEMKSV